MLKNSIEDIRKGLGEGCYPNEASVGTGIVLRILNELGWPAYEPQIVSPEFALEGRRVDYALCHPAARPVVFIEVKRVGHGEGGGHCPGMDHA
jgi:predicted type IV restriction endonuclease